MASLRKLNRRLGRWERYTVRTSLRLTRPAWMRAPAMPRGHDRAWHRREHERERRQCFRFYVVDALADDGPQCNVDSAPGEVCYCTHREGCPFADDQPDDDAGHGDDWPPGVVTEHAFAERGLL
jgi:hypothetical protein